MFRQKRRNVLGNGSDLNSEDAEVVAFVDYPRRLSLYDKKPDAESLPIEQFEQWALDRLEVLSRIDAGREVGGQDFEAKVRKILNEKLPLSTGSGSKRSIDLERRKDHFSHFVLRLAFCRTDTLRKQFIRLESALLKIRYKQCDREEQREFISSLDLNMHQAEEEECERFANELETCSSGDYSANSGSSAQPRYFKVNWRRVPDLVSQRKIFIHHGFAYIPEHLQLSFVVTEFEARLAASMQRLTRMLPKIDSDQRLGELLDNMANGLGEIFNTPNVIDLKSGATMFAESINALDQKNALPLCMSKMHRNFMTTKHAKYDNRNALTNFVRYVGLTCKEAFRYFELGFRDMTHDDVAKEYFYNIRHSYGEVGAKINYSADTCAKLIKGANTQTNYGCAYKLMSPDSLAERLKEMGIEHKSDVNSVLSITASGNYMKACQCVFDLSHPENPMEYDKVITHPIDYTARAIEYDNLKKD